MEDKLILRNLLHRLDRKKITREETAFIMGVSRNTFQRRIEHPEGFTIGELMLICDHLGIGVKELLKY